MRINRSLLDDVEKIRRSLPCTSGCSCKYCRNEKMCMKINHLINSIRKFY